MLEVGQEATEAEEPPSEGLKGWHWALIGIGIALGVIFLIGVASPCGFQSTC